MSSEANPHTCIQWLLSTELTVCMSAASHRLHSYLRTLTHSGHKAKGKGKVADGLKKRVFPEDIFDEVVPIFSLFIALADFFKREDLAL